MTKLDDAITLFYAQSQSPEFSDDARQQFRVLSNALQELDERLIDQKDSRHKLTEAIDGDLLEIENRLKKLEGIEQPAPQPEHTFEPWDCVRAKEGTQLYEEWHDTELVMGHGPDLDGEYHVFSPDDNDDTYVKPEEIVFVRRLKPRAQEPQPKAPEPPAPRFTFGDRVCVDRLEHKTTSFLFLRYYGPYGEMATVIDEKEHIHKVNSKYLTLDTAAD